MVEGGMWFFFFFSSRRRHTRCYRDWSSDVCSSDLLVEAIREKDPGRLVIADGLDLGWTPVPGLAGLSIGQSRHAYDPWGVSHYLASWFPGAEEWDEPTWPLPTGVGVRDKNVLRNERVGPWKALERRGVGIHVGEFGTFNGTPHSVTLAWMEDFL